MRILMLVLLLAGCESWYSDVLDNVNTDIPNWKENWRRCKPNDQDDLTYAIQQLPPKARVVEFLTCTTIIIETGGRCFLVHQDDIGSSWAMVACSPREKENKQGECQ